MTMNPDWDNRAQTPEIETGKAANRAFFQCCGTLSLDIWCKKYHPEILEKLGVSNCLGLIFSMKEHEFDAYQEWLRTKEGKQYLKDGSEWALFYSRGITMPYATPEERD